MSEVITEARRAHNRNVRCSDRLLARLQKYHGVPEPKAEAVEPPPVVEAAPMKAPWFRIISTANPTIRDIQDAIVHRYDISLLDLKSHRKTMPVARYRQLGMYLSKKLTLRSLPEIGRLFGDRDHTTVLHAVRKIDELKRVDPIIAAGVEELTAQLGSYQKSA